MISVSIKAPSMYLRFYALCMHFPFASKMVRILFDRFERDGRIRR